MAKYQLRERLGQGAMGTVHRARQEGLDREVAIKTMSVASTPELLKRFEREARVLAGLVHPNIVRVLDYGEMNGAPFLAMELIEGTTLGDLIGEPPVAPERALPLIAEVADALACLAENGIVHRDLKPPNILVDAQGHAKLVDFGMTRDPGRTGVTEAGTVVGTLKYIPPEAIKGVTPGPEADVWALGLIAYELMTGRTWTEARSHEALMRAIVYDPLPLTTGRAPGWFDRLQARAIERDPAQRITAAEYRDVLQRHAEPRRTRRTKRRERSVKMPRTFVAGFVLAALAGIGLAAWLLRPRPAPARPTPVAVAAPAVVGRPILEMTLNVVESEAYLWALFATPERRAVALQAADGTAIESRVATDRIVRQRFQGLRPSTPYRIVIAGEGNRALASLPFTTESDAYGRNATNMASQVTDLVTLRFALEEGSNWPHPALALAAARGFPLYKPDDHTMVLRAATLLDATGDPALAQALRTQLTGPPRTYENAVAWRALARLGDDAALEQALAALAPPETAAAADIRALTALAEAVGMRRAAKGCDAIAALAEQLPDSLHDFGRALVAADPDRAFAQATRWLAHPRFQGRALRATAVRVLAQLDRLDACPPGALDELPAEAAGNLLWRLAFVPAARPLVAAYRGPARKHAHWGYICAAAQIPAAASDFHERLSSPEPALRRNALWALDALEHHGSTAREMIERVGKALADPDPSVAELAAWIAGQRKLRTLKAALDRRLPETAGAKAFGTGTAAWALGELGEDGRAVVRDALDYQIFAGGRAHATLEQMAYVRGRYKSMDDVDGLSPSVKAFARAGWSWPVRASEASGPCRVRSAGHDDPPPALTGAENPHAAWQASPTTSAATLIVHAQAPFVRTGIALKAGEGVEIESELVRVAEGATPQPAAAGGAGFTTPGRRSLLFPFRDGELLLSAWPLKDEHPPRPPDAPPAALVRFSVRR